MSQKIEVHLIDDVDGADATQTVTFALDGASYEIDLSDENAAKLREQMASWVKSARKTGGRTSRASTATRARRGGPDPAEVRRWAAANGMQAGERGRIPTNVREAYDAAHAS